jgi:hypothetical protein
MIRPPSSISLMTSSCVAVTNLSEVEFCEEIEVLVSAASFQGWWNHGASEISLSTFCFTEWWVYSCLQVFLGGRVETFTVSVVLNLFFVTLHCCSMDILLVNS